MSHQVKFVLGAEMRNNLGKLHKLTLAKARSYTTINARTIRAVFIARLNTIICSCRAGYFSVAVLLLCCAKSRYLDARAS